MPANTPTLEKNELVYKIAKEVYVNGKKQHEVARELEISSPSTISRLLSYGWKTGVITLGYNPTAGRDIERNEALEMALKESFQLQNTIVIHFPYRSEYDLEDDNRLHRSLARALAHHLKIILRSGDHIGVGGGRANYETAKVLYQQGPLPLTNITATAMMGRLSYPPQQNTRQGNHALDADDVAFMLAAAFQQSVAQPISMNLALPSPDTVAELKSVSPGLLLSEDKWRDEPDRFVPDIALTGVGSLDPRGGHAFSDLEALAVDPIREPLGKLLELIKPDEYCPVGDIANRLFFVPPPPGVAIGADVEKEVKRLIDEINDKLLCITLEQLRMVKKVIVAAGGSFKVNALFTLLSQSSPIIHELCTDERTAQGLLMRRER